MAPILSSQIRPRALQVLISYRPHLHIWTSYACIITIRVSYVYRWYVLFLKEEVSLVNRLEAVLTLPGPFLSWEAVLTGFQMNLPIVDFAYHWNLERVEVGRKVPLINGKQLGKFVKIVTQMAFWWILSSNCPCPRHKMLNFPPEVVISWTLKMHSSALCSFGRDLTCCHRRQLRQYFLLHCNTSNLVLEILHDKIWGDKSNKVNKSN